jgi:hypothetical protein
MHVSLTPHEQQGPSGTRPNSPERSTPTSVEPAVYDFRGPPPTGASTISQFCERQNISKPFYYKLRGLGLGPKEMRFLGLVRISREAELEWQKARENPTEDEAQVLSRAAIARRERAIKAATKSVTSAAHISRRGIRR